MLDEAPFFASGGDLTVDMRSSFSQPTSTEVAAQAPLTVGCGDQRGTGAPQCVPTVSDKYDSVPSQSSESSLVANGHRPANGPNISTATCEQGAAASKSLGKNGKNVECHGETTGVSSSVGKYQTLQSLNITDINHNNADLRDIYNKVSHTGQFNFNGARLRLPSGLNIEKWREVLRGYPDYKIVEFLEFDWPIGIDRRATLQSYEMNHTSARNYPADVEHYLTTELKHRALLGPFKGPPTRVCHFSPLMTRPKKGSLFRRVIIDLSWPKGWSVNDAISRTEYINGPMTISLPTPDDMERAVIRAGRGCFHTKQTSHGGTVSSGWTLLTGPSSPSGTGPIASWTFVHRSGFALLPWPCRGFRRP